MQYEQETLRRLQLVELEILKDIDHVCRKHGITYFLDGGTALGAARHKGFIPWDDDIDVGMLRPDYERFLAVAAEELGEGYVVSDPVSNDRNAGMFAKVWKKGTVFATKETMEAGIPQGIFVDVFAYDVLSADAALAAKQRRRCRMWQNASYLYHAKSITVPHKGFVGAMERALCVVAHAVSRAVFSHERIVAAYDRAVRMGADNPSGSYLSFAYVTAEGFPEDVLVPTRTVSFEGEVFPGPSDMERYLRIWYGEGWRELPPVEKRRNHAPVRLDFGDSAIAR